MSNLLIKQKKDSAQNNSKIITKKNKNIFSINALGSLNKGNIEKKNLKELSLNYFKNYTISSYPTNTCVNNNRKKIKMCEISKSYHKKKIFQNLNKAKFKKFKQSNSLKDLIKDENILNLNLRPNHTRKNTNTKIELFSTNSTLSFLNIKDSDKEKVKPVQIKYINEKNKNKEKDEKFSATFIENKIRQYIKNNINIKNKKFDNNDISLKKSSKINIVKQNKSVDFFTTYKKHVNKNRNISFGIGENNNISINKFNIMVKKRNTNSTNLLLDNISLSLNKNKKRTKSKNKIINNVSYSKNNKTCSFNTNKKSNLSSLPNLLCNNFFFNFNDKNKENDKKYKNRNSYQNLLEHKRKNKNFDKIRIIDNKKIRKLFKNFKTINRSSKSKLIKNSKSEEKICLDKNKDIRDKLTIIEKRVKKILDGFYNLYLHTKHNEQIQK